MYEVTYRGVVLQLDENDLQGEWGFKDRDINYTRYYSLREAKKAVDVMLTDAFERSEVYHMGYGSWRDGLSELPDYSVVTVTSVPNGHEAWTRDEQGRRSKSDARRLFALTPENTAIIEQLYALRAQAKALEEEAEQLKESLVPFPTLMATTHQVAIDQTT